MTGTRGLTIKSTTMNSAIISLLHCPSCGRGALSMRVMARTQDAHHIKEGLLVCAACKVFFPVIDWIPRLVVPAMQTAEERMFVARSSSSHHAAPSVVSDSAVTLSPRAREGRIRTLLAAKLRAENADSEKSQQRVAHDLSYRLHHAGATEKYVHTVQPYLTTPVRVLADLGGGQGGTVSTFRRLLNAPLALLIDLDLDYAVIARLRDPAITVIRADARRLPFHNGAIDLLVSFATLEHIADVPSVVGEITRVSTQAFVSFNPNKRSLYDFGHLSAPVTMVPRALIPPIAWLWHRVNGYRWSYARIRKELAIVFYHSRQSVARRLRASGIVRNVFPDFVVHSAQAQYAYRFAGLKKFFRRYPRLVRALAQMLVAVGIEPNVYLFWKSKKKSLSSHSLRSVQALPLHCIQGQGRL